MDAEKETQSTYSGFGPVFSRFYSFFAARSRSSRNTYQYIVNDVSSLGPESILDVGCGPGVLIKMLSDSLPRTKVYGADPSRSMVDIARKMLRNRIEENTVHITIGDSKHIEFDRKFDLIITSMSFHHWDDQKGSLEYLVSLLERGGSIIIYENHRDSSKDSNKKHYHSMSEKESASIEVEGCRKSVRVEGGIISVKLTRYT